MPRKPKAAQAAAPASLTLPEELTIYTVGELHPQWLGWLQALPADGGPATLHGQAVDQVDAAGLQLLLSLGRALNDRGLAWHLPQPSAMLRGGCEALGVGPWLQAHAQPAPGARP